MLRFNLVYLRTFLIHLQKDTHDKKKAITQVIKVPFKGSLFFAFPLAIQLSKPLDGNTLSLPRACRVLGATIIEPKAEEIAAHASPIGIIGPQMAMSLITN